MGFFNKKNEHFFVKPSDATIGQCFSKGNTITKLSFFIHGLGNLLNKQYARGIVFLGIEIAYFIYMISFGFGTLAGLTTLGTVQQEEVWSDELGIYTYTDGDNSMLFLLYGVITIFVTLAFIFFAMMVCPAS